MKLHFQHAGIVASLCAVFLFSCGNPVGPSQKSNYIQGNTYVGGDIKIQLSVPDGWVLTMDTIVGNMSINLMGRKSVVTQVQPNFNLIWSDHSGTSNLNEVLDTAATFILGTLQAPTIVSKQIVQIDGNSFGEIVFDFTFMNIPLREKQLYFIHNNKDIILTFADAKANYPTDSPDFDSIQSSIKVQ